MKTRHIPFKKFHGAGNDFIVLDEGHINPQPDLIARLCHRHLGIGADGLIILSQSKKHDFRISYYNADGYEGSLCGNGSRVAVACWYLNDRSKKQFSFEAVDGLHQGTIIMEHQQQFDVRISMQDVTSYTQTEKYLLVNTGSPHYVTEVDNLASLDVAKLGASIRHDKHISKNGVNVNFLQYLSNDHFWLRTFERGVEAETLSCGTGVTAAAIAASLKTGHEHFFITTKGGDLQVNLIRDEQGFKQIFLRGPVKFVFEGSIHFPEKFLGQSNENL
ncbi:MAG TPA: diaminopimelate epimerase, partial [Bacteroidales bacterium]|nr:diaminopimelate epimerase [Bacteroidales bacterium]